VEEIVGPILFDNLHYQSIPLMFLILEFANIFRCEMKYCAQFFTRIFQQMVGQDIVSFRIFVHISGNSSSPSINF